MIFNDVINSISRLQKGSTNNRFFKHYTILHTKPPIPQNPYFGLSLNAQHLTAFSSHFQWKLNQHPPIQNTVLGNFIFRSLWWDTGGNILLHLDGPQQPYNWLWTVNKTELKQNQTRFWSQMVYLPNKPFTFTSFTFKTWRWPSIWGIAQTKGRFELFTFKEILQN